MSNSLVLSYTAGYTDGDGCFHITKNIRPSGTPKYRLVFIISSVNPEIIKFFSDQFGGIYKLADKRVKFQNQKPQFHFYLGGKKCYFFTKILLSYLIEKKEEAELIANFYDSTSEEEKERLYFHLKELKNTQNLVDKESVEALRQSKKIEFFSEEEFSYIAGFIDAECCFGLSRYRRNGCKNFIYKPILTCNNTKTPTIKWIFQRWGGSLSFISRKSQNPSHRNQIMWSVSSANLRKFLPKIIPYLKYKKPVALELMKFFETSPPEGDRQSDSFKVLYSQILSTRDEIFHKIHFLNRKGI